MSDTGYWRRVLYQMSYIRKRGERALITTIPGKRVEQNRRKHKFNEQTNLLCADETKRLKAKLTYVIKSRKNKIQIC